MKKAQGFLIVFIILFTLIVIISGALLYITLTEDKEEIITKPVQQEKETIREIVKAPKSIEQESSNIEPVQDEEPEPEQEYEPEPEEEYESEPEQEYEPEPEEECSTNSDCDDNDISTRDRCSIGKCYNTEIVNCINNDGYCPSDCDYIFDNDCTQEGYDVDIDISFSKNSYEIGETVEGRFSITNNGENFRVYAITNLRKDSGSWICGSTTTMYIGSTSWNVGVVDLTDPTYFSCTGDSFPQEGAYTYRLIIYDCEDVEAEFGGDCFNADRTDIISQVNPIDEVTETITVI